MCNTDVLRERLYVAEIAGQDWPEQDELSAGRAGLVDVADGNRRANEHGPASKQGRQDRLYCLMNRHGIGEKGRKGSKGGDEKLLAPRRQPPARLAQALRQLR